MTLRLHYDYTQWTLWLPCVHPKNPGYAPVWNKAGVYGEMGLINYECFHCENSTFMGVNSLTPCDNPRRYVWHPRSPSLISNSAPVSFHTIHCGKSAVLMRFCWNICLAVGASNGDPPTYLLILTTSRASGTYQLGYIVFWTSNYFYFRENNLFFPQSGTCMALAMPCTCH